MSGCLLTGRHQDWQMVKTSRAHPPCSARYSLMGSRHRRATLEVGRMLTCCFAAAPPLLLSDWRILANGHFGFSAGILIRLPRRRPGHARGILASPTDTTQKDNDCPFASWSVLQGRFRKCSTSSAFAIISSAPKV